MSLLLLFKTGVTGLGNPAKRELPDTHFQDGAIWPGYQIGRRGTKPLVYPFRGKCDGDLVRGDIALAIQTGGQASKPLHLFHPALCVDDGTLPQDKPLLGVQIGGKDDKPLILGFCEECQICNALCEGGAPATLTATDSGLDGFTAMSYLYLGNPQTLYKSFPCDTVPAIAPYYAGSTFPVNLSSVHNLACVDHGRSLIYGEDVKGKWVYYLRVSRLDFGIPGGFAIYDFLEFGDPTSLDPFLMTVNGTFQDTIPASTSDSTRTGNAWTNDPAVLGLDYEITITE